MKSEYIVTMITLRGVVHMWTGRYENSRDAFDSTLDKAAEKDDYPAEVKLKKV